MSDTWEAIAQDKRERILDAALSAFAANGYRKTSAADVAKAANISKAMVFTYFGSKPQMYEFLCGYAMELVWTEFRANAHKLLTDDFFERIRLSVEIKTALMKRHGAILAFLTSMYFEQDGEVRPAIDKHLANSFSLRSEHMLTGIDASRFRREIDSKLVTKMLTWLSSGLADEWRGGSAETLDELTAAFDRILEMLKNSFYKEEFTGGDI
ncbi:MAG: TetR/AcrR family transcriptional regulator [Oscillospiraceae bacterium]|nr:TetR/AcrR family transcriptional regulator [Oscillospiraceae bacterium]